MLSYHCTSKAMEREILMIFSPNVSKEMIRGKGYWLSEEKNLLYGN